MRVALDTNVVVRAANPAVGPARQILHLLLTGSHVIVTSPFLLAELDRAIHYPRLRRLHCLSDQAIRQFIHDYQSQSEVVNIPFGAATGIVRDSQDDAVLQTAILGRADYLCTGDKDLLTDFVREYAARCGVIIATEAMLLQKLATP